MVIRIITVGDLGFSVGSAFPRLDPRQLLSASRAHFRSSVFMPLASMPAACEQIAGEIAHRDSISNLDGLAG